MYEKESFEKNLQIDKFVEKQQYLIHITFLQTSKPILVKRKNRKQTYSDLASNDLFHYLLSEMDIIMPLPC